MSENNEITLTSSREDIKERLLTETDPDEINRILNIFNVNFVKQDAIRKVELMDLQDKITRQMSERVDKRVNEFSNKDLLDYHKVINDTISRTDPTMQNVDVSSIKIQNNVNINVNNEGEEKLDRQSKQRVIDTVQKILQQCSQPSQQLDEDKIIEVPAEDIVIDNGGDIDDL